MTPCTQTPGKIVVVCPSCEKRLRVPDGMKTRAKVSCRSCGQVFRIGQRKSAAGPAADHADRQHRSPAESVRHRSRAKPALLLLMLGLLGAGLCEIARRSVNQSTIAQRPMDGATPEASATPFSQLADSDAGQAIERQSEQDPPSTPAPAPTDSKNDTWKVGELVMAQWSEDEYWYPARIEKIAGDRFEIKHLDGTAETVSADKLAKDSLQEGDRVAVDWKREGRYYAGKILSRQGDALRVRYDDDDEENTTIAAVRIWPNGEEDAVQRDEEPVYHEQYAANRRDHRADLQAYLNGEAQLHRMYAAQARQQEANIRAEAQQMQNDIMNRQHYEGLNRLNNAVPGFQPWPY
jgi:hypothetical protein